MESHHALAMAVLLLFVAFIMVMRARRYHYLMTKKILSEDTYDRLKCQTVSSVASTLILVTIAAAIIINELIIALA